MDNLSLCEMETAWMLDRSSSAWGYHLTQGAPAFSCPSQVGCRVLAAFSCVTCREVIENGFPFSIIPLMF